MHNQPHARPATPPRALTRRGFLGAAGVALGLGAAGGYVTGRAAATDRPPATPDFAPDRPLLLQGATVLTLAPATQALPDHDVLVQDGKIAALGPGLAAPADAAVVDARGKILMPGMVDTHRHVWQTPFRGFGANWSFADYLQYMREQFGLRFTTEDFYNATFMGLVDALDAGVTSTVDWSHGLRSTADAEAALQAAHDSGGRVRFAWGRAAGAEIAVVPDWVLEGDVARVVRDPSLVGGLVSLQLALDWSGRPGFPDAAAWRWAREQGLPVTTHAGLYGAIEDEFITQLQQNDLLLPSTTYVHAGTLRPESYDLIAASGGAVSIAPESEFNFGQGYPPTADVAARGIRVGLSTDTVTYQSADVLSAMRAVLNGDRAEQNLEAQNARAAISPPRLSVDTVLEWGTLGGARVLGSDAEIGTIEIGKRADLVLLSTESPAMANADNYPQGAAVLHATRDEVDAVLVDGRVIKYAGELTGDLAARARRLGTTTRDRIIAQLDPAALEQTRHPARS